MAVAALFKVVGVVAVAVSTAALLTWEKARQNARDINQCFCKLRKMEKDIERIKESLSKQDRLD